VQNKIIDRGENPHQENRQGLNAVAVGATRESPVGPKHPKHSAQMVVRKLNGQKVHAGGQLHHKSLKG
jgi:hypothetical protein